MQGEGAGGPAGPDGYMAYYIIREREPETGESSGYSRDSALMREIARVGMLGVQG